MTVQYHIGWETPVEAERPARIHLPGRRVLGKHPESVENTCSSL